MKTNWVATRYARKVKALALRIIFPGVVCLIFLTISCEKSDDLFLIDNSSTTNNESPVNNDPPNIIYTDIEPDFNSENISDFYELDLNNDNIVDFTLIGNSESGWEWLSISSNSNYRNAIFSIAPWYTHPIPLNVGKKIFTIAGYTNGESYTSWGIFSIGECYNGEVDCFYDWKEKGDRYLGLRVIINGQTHYGWARLNLISPDQWVIKDYAFNATPESSILAGQVE